MPTQIGRNLLYIQGLISFTPLAGHFHKLPEILDPRQSAALGLFHEGILGPYIRPSRRQIGQLAVWGKIINPPLPPPLLTIDQL